MERQRQWHTEKRHFKQKWEEDYFFAEISSKAVCLICQQSVAVLKEYNLRRHYETEHAVFSRYKGEARKKKSSELLRSKQATFTRPSTAQDCATLASYEISALLAKSGRSFSTGDFVKECLSPAASIIDPPLKSKDFFAFSLQTFRIQRRFWVFWRDLRRCEGRQEVKISGFTALVSQRVSECGGKVAQYHCILHQEQLCAKTIGLAYVVRDVVKIINCIRSKALSHRRLLKIYFELRQLIVEFFSSASRDTQIPSDKRWIFDVAFMVDITDLLNNLNVKLQGKEQIITELFDHIKAFQMKLQLLCRHLSAGNLTEVNVEVDRLPEYGELLSNLNKEFDFHFVDFKKTAGDMELFSQPFSVSLDLVPEHLKMEFIEFQCDTELRRKFVSLPLRDFYPHVSVQRYPQMRKNAQVMLSLFGSTYICEQTFSLMNLKKIKLRGTLTDSHLQDIQTLVSKLQPNIQSLKSKDQLHVSH
uniref:SPIN-DOC-like zinc-finger domain-containing protein n=1 Tax=Oryzias latipes TaxID=8090 RepID=A0A3P9L8G5_ORYLA